MSDIAKVSVIVPVYNAEEYIHSTMEMLCQSYLNDIEIVAVNDGSNDGSLEALRECARIDSRIKVVDKPNGGIADARNRGLREASGEYVCFCDQDDVVEPDMYDIMYRKAKQSQCELAICSTGRIVNGVKSSYWVCREAVVTGKEVQEDCFLSSIFTSSTIYNSNKNTVILNMVWNCMVSREFIESNNLRFRSYVDFEDDRLFVLDILARAKKIVYVPDVLYYWTVNLQSESHNPKYIEDFYKKSLELQNAVTDIMRIAGSSDKYIHMYELFNSANRYAGMVENEVNHVSVNFKQRIAILRNIYVEDRFKENIKAARYYTRVMVVRKNVCKLLRIKAVVLAYCCVKVWGIIKDKGKKNFVWNRLEKKAQEFTD